MDGWMDEKAADLAGRITPPSTACLVNKCMSVIFCVCRATCPILVVPHFQLAKGGDSPKWEKSPLFLTTWGGHGARARPSVPITGIEYKDRI